VYRAKHSSSHPESATLLQDGPGNGGPQHAPSPSITDRLGSILQDPLTPLNKILLILLLLFLLLCSIFVGLFIGSQHKLNNVPDTPGGEKPPITFTSVVTVPSTTTATVTTTVVGVPPPGPSTPPERVSLPYHLFIPPFFFDKLAERKRVLLSGMRCAFCSHPLFLGHYTGSL
jgi:endothelin-converting enzyme